MMTAEERARIAVFASTNILRAHPVSMIADAIRNAQREAYEDCKKMVACSLGYDCDLVSDIESRMKEVLGYLVNPNL